MVKVDGLERAQSLLGKLKIDAYLVYDFRGSNFIGREISGFSGMNTRRLVVIVDKAEIYVIASLMEKSVVESIRGKKFFYKTYTEFQDLIKERIKKYKRIALDYSPLNALPIGDIVPAGFLEFLRSSYPSKEFVSSENLTQYIASTWGKSGYGSHKEAAKKLNEVFNITFDYIKKSLKNKKKVTDYDASVVALEAMRKKGLHNDGEDVCIVATNERTANPHYWPTKERNYGIKPNSILIIDLWARTKQKRSVYADFTMYAWIGPNKIPREVSKAWEVLTEARDLGIEFLNKNLGKDIKGFEVDKVVYDHLSKNGYAKYLQHRTGHSLGRKEHGNGANIDDFETHDTRLLLPDSGFTIEPGLYLGKKYGVRGEIDLYINPKNKLEVTTPLQKEIILI